MRRSSVPSSRQIVRIVDGWGHVVVGPPLLAAGRPLAEAVGLPARALRTFLGGFVAYGGHVLYRTRRGAGDSVRGLIPVALAANISFVELCVAALRTDELKPLGKAAALNGIATGSAMTALLATSGARTPRLRRQP